jgi:hypothetical protein
MSPFNYFGLRFCKCLYPMVIALVPLLLCSCSYLIDISVRGGPVPIFGFSYRKTAHKDVELNYLRIVHPETGKTIWEIGTETSPAFMYRSGKVNKLEVSKDKVTKDIVNIKIVELRFGDLPNGFTQLIPENQQIPLIKEGEIYTLYVEGGGGGFANWTCKQICTRLAE